MRLGVTSPILRAALADLIRVQGESGGMWQVVDPAQAPADLVVDDVDGPVRLGRILDWAGLRAARIQATPPAKIGFSSGVFIPKIRTFEHTDTRTSVRLTEREADFILYLHDSPEHTRTREEILRDVWGYAHGLETHTLETHVYRLRQKIEVDPALPTVLLTVEGGYRLVFS